MCPLPHRWPHPHLLPEETSRCSTPQLQGLAAHSSLSSPRQSLQRRLGPQFLLLFTNISNAPFATIFIYFPNVKSASWQPSIIMCPYSTPNPSDLQVQSSLTTHGAQEVPFHPLASHSACCQVTPRSALSPDLTVAQAEGPAHQAVCSPGRPPISHVEKLPQHPCLVPGPPRNSPERVHFLLCFGFPVTDLYPTNPSKSSSKL